MKVIQRIFLLLTVLVIVCSFAREVRTQGNCITDLVSHINHSGNVLLVWTHIAGTEYYEIWSKEDPSDPFSVIDTTTSTHSSYTDFHTVSGITYYYFVRRVWNGGNSQCDSNMVYGGSSADPDTIDNDFDGFTENTGDCNDNDLEINPGMIEIPYNGKDDDCNPATPDDDLDGDGFVIASDCDDNDATINPAAQEVCDGVDNNCDGQTDEPIILFTSPVDGSTIDLSSTLVTGTINTCSQEVGIVSPCNGCRKCVCSQRHTSGNRCKHINRYSHR